MTPEKLVEWQRLFGMPTVSKRELFALVALHALLSIPPDQRPKSVVKASVHAADLLLNELVEKK